MKKNISNITTTVRIGSSFCLIFFEASSFMFIFFYIMAGITDMLDGFLTRKWNSVTFFGEKYDSFADLVFIGVCIFKILPTLHLPIWGDTLDRSDCIDKSSEFGDILLSA